MSILFQARVQEWIVNCFGSKKALDKTTRTARFFEEAVELVQSAGFSKEDCHTLVEYVYKQPTGKPEQEVGGVVLTLAGFCSAHKLNMSEAAQKELTRCQNKINQIREKNSKKHRPKHNNIENKNEQ